MQQSGKKIDNHAFAIRKLALDPIPPQDQLNVSRNRLPSGQLDVDSLEISEISAMTHDNVRLEKHHENDDSSAPSYFCSCRTMVTNILLGVNDTDSEIQPSRTSSTIAGDYVPEANRTKPSIREAFNGERDTAISKLNDKGDCWKKIRGTLESSINAPSSCSGWLKT